MVKWFKTTIKKIKVKLFHPRKILLITNRGSDNCGDQVLEACDISLIRTVMKDLHVSRLRYSIESRDAGLVRKAYLQNHDPKLLEDAKKTISSCDLVLFGGAPMFNHLYQVFYERTCMMIEMAQEYGKPVVFSAVGIEVYDGNNPKCQRIRESVNLPCVKSVTTRDDFEALRQIRAREDLPIERVPDPAVFSDMVFRKFKGAAEGRKKKRIGVFVLRGMGFADNRKDFSYDSVIRFYSELYRMLIAHKYEPRFMTSGHFADEATLQYLITTQGLAKRHCVTNMLSPEQLFEEVSSCDGVISCRLHPSIVAYSCKIPSIGIEWNSKVSGFYDSVGIGDRVVRTEELTAEHVLTLLEKALSEGVSKDEAYMYRLYETLFEGIRRSLYPDKKASPSSPDALGGRIVPYGGTKQAEMELKIERKFKRTYEKYNDAQKKLREIKDGK